jgi:flagellar hook-associated protein 3 FlgL
MRIATITIYNNQTSSIDNLSSQYQNIGNQLSTGKSLNVPSDDPSQVSQDLQIRSTIAAEDSDASNATAASQELTFTDATLSQLTSVLQSARNLAVEGANDIIPNGSQRPLLGKQVDGLLNQALALANTMYGTNYIFAGTGAATTAPVTPLGSPANAIAFTGNNDARTEVINGQTVQVGTTLQSAFNYNSTNGTPSVFTLLATLRDTLDKEPAAIESQRSINVQNQVIYGPTAPAAQQTTLGQLASAGGPSSVKLTPDNSTPAAGVPAGNYSFHIDGTTALGQPGSQTFTFNSNSTVSDILNQINTSTATTGVTAAWNQASQRLQLTSVSPNSPPFLITDAATPVGATPIVNGVPGAAITTAATTTSNIMEVFQIPSQVSVTSNLSTQIGDIDDVINSVLSSRASVGQTIQNLAATSSQVQALSVDNTTTKSTYEDTNVAQATSQFTLTQTALQAAYATTTRLEGKSLIDYL